MIDNSTYAATDSWFHYDQVGSVMDVTVSSADDTQLYQDAWGNPMPDWTSGHWQTGVDRWGHNSKEVDGDTGLVYMHQRWYQHNAATFISSAPYPPYMEHRYGFSVNYPVGLTDVSGQLIDQTCKQDCMDRLNKKYGRKDDPNNPYHFITVWCSSECDTYPRNSFFNTNCKEGCDEAVLEVESRLGSYGWSCYCKEDNSFGLPDDAFGTHFYMTCVGPNGETDTHNRTIGFWPGAWFAW